MISGLISNLVLLRRLALVLGAAGVVWGAIETLVALDVLAADSALSPLDGRTGFGIGLAALACWLGAAAGTAVVLRYTAAAATLLFLAACGGFAALGATWIGPGTLMAMASWSALLGITNPFQAEMDREAAARAAAARNPTPQE